MRPAIARNLTPYANMAECILKRALESEGNFRNGELRYVGARRFSDLTSFEIEGQ